MASPESLEPKSPEERHEISVAGGKETSLPPVINLPLTAENLTFEVKITKTTDQERETLTEEKRVAATEKSASATEKRVRGYILLGVVVASTALCFYEIFFAHPDEATRQFAEKIILILVAFIVGNSLPKIFPEGDDKKKE